MTLEAVRTYCLSRVGVMEAMPFGPDVLVYKIGGKMFALINIERLPLSINLKCDPERALELRERHPEIAPGYHQNKKHWNTVELTGRLPTTMVQELIDHSYSLVCENLPARTRRELAGL